MPCPVKLTESGSYDPVSLFHYLDQKRRVKAAPRIIAEELGIPLHRAAYALSDGGFEAFRQRARRAEQQARVAT